ncbi:hypothetical protein M885DRAFT_232564 [Pelagophyceae sp. CCMP2097]|nr:hypothetical protein M885DRAFT_232564 [Pelagophyceae sp. CCMP2097]
MGSSQSAHERPLPPPTCGCLSSSGPARLVWLASRRASHKPLEIRFEEDGVVDVDVRRLAAVAGRRGGFRVVAARPSPIRGRVVPPRRGRARRPNERRRAEPPREPRRGRSVAAQRRSRVRTMHRLLRGAAILAAGGGPAASPARPRGTSLLQTRPRAARRTAVAAPAAPPARACAPRRRREPQSRRPRASTRAAPTSR